MICFKILQSRLISRLRASVRNGELSERRIALLTGISQPHVHNVLKGARILSPGVADLILLHLHISLAELLEPDAADRGNQDQTLRAVPILEGAIGPGHQYPAGPGVEHQMIPSNALARLMDPVLARVARDPSVGDPFLEGRLVLLEQYVQARQLIEADSHYVVNGPAGSAIRLVRHGMGCLYLFTDYSRDRLRSWERIVLGDRDALDVIRAKVIALIGS